MAKAHHKMCKRCGKRLKPSTTMIKQAAAAARDQQLEQTD
jgi:hypothetical protein